MITRTFLLLTMAAMLSRQPVLAQGQLFNGLTTYQIGDIMPAISLGKLVNYKSDSANFSDFRGKLVILDFWATWCTPCLKALSKLDTLQRKYPEKVVIIPIDDQSRGETAERATTYLRKLKVGLPSVVGDTVLRQLFPHRGIPHEIWIGRDGKILAITSDTAVTEHNIETVLDGGTLTLKEKLDDVNFDLDQPLFIHGNGGTGSDYLYRSILAGRRDGLGTMSSQHWNDADLRQYGKYNFDRYTGINLPLLSLYYMALSLYRSSPLVHPARVFIETKDSVYHPNDYCYNYAHNWYDSTLYCFTLNLADGVPDSVFYRQYMLEDLNRVFHKRGQICRRKIPTWVIVRGEDRLNPLSTNGDTASKKEGYIGGQRFMQFGDEQQKYLESVKDMPFDYLIRFWNERYLLLPPIVDESGYAGRPVTMNLHLPFNASDALDALPDITVWRSVLQKYGMDIKEEERETEVLILFN
jgi:thiol-disulfide isomerase/thioredoxin